MSTIICGVPAPDRAGKKERDFPGHLGIIGDKRRTA